MTLVPTQVDQGAILQALGIDPKDVKALAAVLVCQRYDLDPLLKHMQIVKDNIYITRDGFLHVAHRSGVFDGMELIDEGETETYYYAKVAVYRKDMTRPFVAVARCKKDERVFGDPWDMAVTRAERRALKRAFDVAGLPHEGEYDEIPDVVQSVNVVMPPGSDGAGVVAAIKAATPHTFEEPPLPDEPVQQTDPVPVGSADGPLAPDDFTLLAIGEALDKLTDEFKTDCRDEWKRAHLPKPADLTAAQADVAWDLVQTHSRQQKATYDRRRKRANACLTDVGIKGDEDRHAAIEVATDDAASSSAALTEEQVEQIATYCKQVKEAKSDNNANA